MTDIFITKSGVVYPLTGTVAGVWDINNISDNGLAFFNEDGSIISDVTNITSITSANITGDYVYIGYINKDKISRNSVRIPRKTFNYSKLVYTAPVAAVKVLGGEASGIASTYSLNLPSSISSGNIYGVVVIDKSKPFDNTQRVKEYSSIVVNGDTLTGTGISNIITKLVSKINADPIGVATAVALTDGTNNTGIKFTAKIAINDFEISNVDGVLKDSDIVEYKIVNGKYTNSSTTTVVAYNVGHGTEASIRTSEKATMVYSGKSNGRLLENELWSSASNVITGATYYSYILSFTASRDSKLNLDENLKQVIGIFPVVESATIGSAIISGTLTVGKTYRITTFVTSDDFSNVGGTNVSGDVFVATGTTPTTWTNSSSLIRLRDTTTIYALDTILPLVKK